MTDKQKKRIVERVARLSTEEQIRKYGSPEQKQESGEWEERFEKLTIECFSSDFKKLKYFTWKFKEHALKSFISTELQEAERRGMKKVADKITEMMFSYLDDFGTFDFEGFGKCVDNYIQDIKKLLKK